MSSYVRDENFDKKMNTRRERKTDITCLRTIFVETTQGQSRLGAMTPEAKCAVWAFGNLDCTVSISKGQLALPEI